MANWKMGLAGLALSSLGMSALVAPPAQAAVVIIHGGRDEPPPPREEHVVERRGYVWDRGHYGWRHHHYVWTRGHYVRERRDQEWAPGALGTARGPLRLARRRVAPAPLRCDWAKKNGRD